MTAIDIFNGDADGICALVQLRNSEPKSSQLITGVKRDIALVGQAMCSKDDEVTVLDISYDKNRDGVENALRAGANILYFDHHYAGNISKNNQLQAHINTTSDICTSLLVNDYLQGKFLAWAVVGAFGDNLKKSATQAAKPLGLSLEALASLEALGIYINYNGYGANLNDLHFHPAELYRRLVKFPNPFAFMAEDRDSFDKLQQGYMTDMASASNIKPHYASANTAVFYFPNEAWARRVSGVYSNDLANAYPNRAHAVLTEKVNGKYLVSVRAPLNNKTGADEICRQFPTGGGRMAAAGINDLPVELIEPFIETMNNFYT